MQFCSPQTKIQTKRFSAPLLEGLCIRLSGLHTHYLVSSKPFWNGVGHLEIVGLKSRFSFTFLYLRNIPQGVSRGDTYILKVFMAASKKTSAKCWLQREPPPLITLLINII